MIHRGAKVLDDRIADIRARFDPRSLLFEPLDPAADVQRLAAVPGVAQVNREGGGWELVLRPEAERAAVITAVATALPPARLELRRPTLEDVFVNIVTSDAGDSEAAALRAAVRDPAHAEGEVRA